MNMIRQVSWLSALLLLTGLLSGCATEKRVTRVDTGVTTDLSGRWNDTDSKQVAEKMISEMLSRPWLGNFTSQQTRQPVVIVGTVENLSHEHINTQTFISDLEREMTNSQKVTFVADKSDRQEVREERLDQASHSRQDTQKAPGREIGADYIMKGRISTIQDEAEGTKAIFYQVDLELVSLADNTKSWYGQHKIKKVIERKRTIF
ncbi:penicillin-binding protein activator LpoB [Candidatus Nitronereus thalassa]|uniref:Penicillin-binding protein activator LpoB n=1 Tax=Candidatus Nitronereus thalassa TaxID=3020898 RepID=A0ABU3KBT9_9BACT|nr:penicillin-binding protein activator LpoB [Candidatus Nitronereus thalassa]MDT7043975.1 penicillin-binding protein activator LpoB [Candidatus Nitronereus thalassa]